MSTYDKFKVAIGIASFEDLRNVSSVLIKYAKHYVSNNTCKDMVTPDELYSTFENLDIRDYIRSLYVENPGWVDYDTDCKYLVELLLAANLVSSIEVEWNLPVGLDKTLCVDKIVKVIKDELNEYNMFNLKINMEILQMTTQLVNHQYTLLNRTQRLNEAVDLFKVEAMKAKMKDQDHGT